MQKYVVEFWYVMQNQSLLFEVLTKDSYQDISNNQYDNIND